MAEKNSSTFILPSDDEVIVESMDVGDANEIFSDEDSPETQLYNMLNSGIHFKVGEDSKLEYKWRKQFDCDNFASMVSKRIITFGKQFHFEKECSSRKCDYGKRSEENPLGKGISHTVILGENTIKNENGDPIPNPQALKTIVFEKKGLKCDGKKAFAVDKASGRYIVDLLDEKETIVLRLLRGTDSEELQKVQKYPEKANKKLSEMIKIRTVGIIGKEKDKVKDWRKAKYKKPDDEFFIKMSFADMQDIIEIHQHIDGGIETDIDENCPLCNSKMFSKETESTTIPFMSKSFFSRGSRLTT